MNHYCCWDKAHPSSLVCEIFLFPSYTNHCPSYALCSFHTILPKQDMCIHNPKTLLYDALPGIPFWMLFCLANSLWCFKSQLQYYLASLVFPVLVLYTNLHSPQGSQNHQRQLPQHSIRIMGVASWLHCRPQSGSVSSNDIHYKSNIS